MSSQTILLLALVLSPLALVAAAPAAGAHEGYCVNGQCEEVANVVGNCYAYVGGPLVRCQV